MKWHEGGLANAKHEEHKQHCPSALAHAVSHDPTGNKFQCSGECVGHHHGRKQQANRGAQEHPKVDAGPALGLLGPLVGNQRIGRQGEDLIEDEQREHVLREGNANGCKNCNRKAGKKSCLVFLAGTAHVTNCIDRGEYPKARCNQCEDHSKGFDGKAKRNPRDDLKQGHPKGLTRLDSQEDAKHGSKDSQRTGHHEAVSQVWTPAKQCDAEGRNQRQKDRQENERFTGHGSGPSRLADSRLASANGRLGSMPNQRLAKTRR